jgi:septation ring formation regulator EzrA
MIITKKKHLSVMEQLKKMYEKDMELKDFIAKNKNDEINDLARQFELERENSNSLFEANRKIIQELSKIRKENKHLKNRCSRLEKKTKFTGGK